MVKAEFYFHLSLISVRVRADLLGPQIIASGYPITALTMRSQECCVHSTDVYERLRILCNPESRMGDT